MCHGGHLVFKDDQEDEDFNIPGDGTYTLVEDINYYSTPESSRRLTVL